MKPACKPQIGTRLSYNKMPPKKKSDLSSRSVRAKRKRLMRSLEPDEVRSARLAANRKRRARRLALETPFEREARLNRDRNRRILDRNKQKVRLRRIYKDSVNELSYKYISQGASSRTPVTPSVKNEQNRATGRQQKLKEHSDIKENIQKINSQSCAQVSRSQHNDYEPETAVGSCSKDTPMVNVFDNIKLEIEE